MVSILADMMNDDVWDKISIDHFMTSPTYTIRSDASIDEAVIFAIDKNIRHLPVVDNDNKLIGLLTQTDIVNGLLKYS